VTRPGTSTSFWPALIGLFASSGSLVCCALPALLVALGAGAALSGLVTALPQLVWLSEHKAPVFGAAGLLLALNGVLQWRNRTAPCPLDPVLRQSCLRTRRAALRLYVGSVGVFVVGGWFAFVQPWLMAD